MASKALRFVTKDGIGRGMREAGARLREHSELLEVRVVVAAVVVAAVVVAAVVAVDLNLVNQVSESVYALWALTLLVCLWALTLSSASANLCWFVRHHLIVTWKRLRRFSRVTALWYLGMASLPLSPTTPSWLLPPL
jgi:uncharacterized membrane protein YqjE